MKSIIIKIAIVLIAMLVIPLGRGLFFYDAFNIYSATPVDLPGYESIVVVPAAPSTEFSDVYEEGEGIILIDLAHANAFDKEELNVLVLRLVSRGMTVRFLSMYDDLESELLGEGEEGEEVEGGPSGADAYIVISPQMEFFKEEVETIDEFVEQGGKLLLIADPTRYSEMGSLSLHFGLIFEADYLYNQVENETSYRNIFLTEFEENEITNNLEKIVLYTAGSISSAGGGIIFVDENTFSSLIETRTRLSPIAQASDFHVLAIYDLTFITEPYNGIYDNNRLISNIADWLASPAEEEEEVGGEKEETSEMD